MRSIEFLMITGAITLYASCSSAEQVNLRCESVFDNSYSKFEVGVEPYLERENYIAIVAMDIESEALIKISGDLAFDLADITYDCSEPTWNVQVSSDEIRIFADIVQCGKSIPSDLPLSMVINRFTGKFRRTFGSISGPVHYAEGVCSAVDKRF